MEFVGCANCWSLAKIALTCSCMPSLWNGKQALSGLLVFCMIFKFCDSYICRLRPLMDRGLLSELRLCVFVEFHIHRFPLGVACSELKSGPRKGALRGMSRSVHDWPCPLQTGTCHGIGFDPLHWKGKGSLSEINPIVYKSLEILCVKA